MPLPVIHSETQKRRTMENEDREFTTMWITLWLLCDVAIWWRPLGYLGTDTKILLTCPVAVLCALILTKGVQTALCGCGYHRWDPCVCSRSGCSASRGHVGDGCRCQRCRAPISGAHHYTEGSPCVCVVCGFERHIWGDRWRDRTQQTFCKRCAKIGYEHVSHPSGVV